MQHSYEPEEPCRKCKCILPLSLLRKHITDCEGESVDLTGLVVWGSGTKWVQLVNDLEPDLLIHILVDETVML